MKTETKVERKERIFTECFGKRAPAAQRAWDRGERMTTQDWADDMEFFKQQDAKRKQFYPVCYIIRDKKFYYKIGYAKNLYRRMGALQVGCPTRLTICAVLADTKARDTEASLHRMFDVYRARGEWFYFDGERMPVFDSKPHPLIPIVGFEHDVYSNLDSAWKFIECSDFETSKWEIMRGFQSEIEEKRGLLASWLDMDGEDKMTKKKMFLCVQESVHLLSKFDDARDGLGI